MQCNLCDCLYSETQIPFMLPCGHTTCNACVAKIQQEGFPCPHCARPFKYSFQNLALSSRSSRNSLPQFCDLCDAAETKAHPPTFKCLDCSQFLCDSTARFHINQNISCLHKLVSFSELSSENTDSALLRLLPKCCPTHNQPSSHYNESIQCSHLLCVSCVTEKALTTSSIPFSTPSLSRLKVQQVRNYIPKISDRIAFLTSTSQTISDKIQQLDQSRDLALSQIKQTFQTYRQALDAREEELKGRVEELHKSAQFEMEEEVDRARLYVGQLEQYAKGLGEMEDTLSKTTSSSSSSISESLLVNVCLLEASLRASFSSLKVEVSTARVEFTVPEEMEWMDNLSGLGKVSHSINLSGRTLLNSSEKGELEVVRALLDRGDDIHQKDKDGRTPLFVASREGHHSIVTLLLDRGANVNEKMKNNRLLGTCRILSPEQVRQQQREDQDGWTPLHIASLNGHLSIVSLLLDRGANINEKINTLLLQNLRTALHIASQEGHLPIASLLLDRGANIHEKNMFGCTVLHFATEQGHLSIVSLLLDRGANIYEKDNMGCTALSIASRKGHLPMVTLLLDRRANIHDKMKGGITPLHIAIQEGHLPITSLFLNRGANIHEKYQSGYTPLHIASQHGYLTIVSLLLDRGANINEKRNDGKTPLKVAVDQKKVDVAALLRERGGTI